MVLLLALACGPGAPETVAAPPAPAPEVAAGPRWLGEAVVVAARGGAVLTLLRRDRDPPGLYVERQDSSGAVRLGAIPGPVDAAHTLGLLGEDGAWALTWGEPGDGPLALRSSGGARTTPAAAEDVRARVAVAEGAGALIGGWTGVHSDQQAFTGFLLRVDGEGHPLGEWTLDVPVDGAPAFEASVDALARAPGGACLAGHHTAGGSGEREGLWIGRLEGAAIVGPTPIEGRDPSWTTAAPALRGEAAGCLIAWTDADTLHLRRHDAALVRTGGVDLPLGEGPRPVGLWFAPGEALSVVLWRATREGGFAEVRALDAVSLAEQGRRSLPLPPVAAAVGVVEVAGRPLLVGQAAHGDGRQAFALALGADAR